MVQDGFDEPRRRSEPLGGTRTPPPHGHGRTAHIDERGGLVCENRPPTFQPIRPRCTWPPHPGGFGSRVTLGSTHSRCERRRPGPYSWCSPAPSGTISIWSSNGRRAILETGFCVSQHISFSHAGPNVATRPRGASGQTITDYAGTEPVPLSCCGHRLSASAGLAMAFTHMRATDSGDTGRYPGDPLHIRGFSRALSPGVGQSRINCALTSARNNTAPARRYKYTSTTMAALKLPYVTP